MNLLPEETDVPELDPVDELDDHPSPIVYPLGVALWVVGAFVLLATVPPEARSMSTGIVIFLLPLGMAVLAAFLNLFTRPGRPLALRYAARTLTYACLFPFVAWGQWEASRRKTR